MRGRNKKTIEEMEIEVAELITKSGRYEQEIHMDFVAYIAVTKTHK